MTFQEVGSLTPRPALLILNAEAYRFEIHPHFHGLVEILVFNDFLYDLDEFAHEVYVLFILIH